MADQERIWGWHQTITDPDHHRAADVLRRSRVGVLRPVREPDGDVTVEQRSLADYDTALGIEPGSEGGFAS